MYYQDGQFLGVPYAQNSLLAVRTKMRLILNHNKDIVRFFNPRRISWLEHVERLPNERMRNKVRKKTSQENGREVDKDILFHSLLEMRRASVQNPP